MLIWWWEIVYSFFISKSHVIYRWSMSIQLFFCARYATYYMEAAASKLKNFTQEVRRLESHDYHPNPLLIIKLIPFVYSIKKRTLSIYCVVIKYYSLSTAAFTKIIRFGEYVVRTVILYTHTYIHTFLFLLLLQHAQLRASVWLPYLALKKNNSKSSCCMYVKKPLVSSSTTKKTSHRSIDFSRFQKSSSTKPFSFHSKKKNWAAQWCGVVWSSLITVNFKKTFVDILLTSGIGSLVFK